MKRDIDATFSKGLIAADIDRSKCLHATSPNALFCTHNVGNVLYHNFSHGDVSYKFSGKNVNVMLELIFIILPIHDWLGEFWIFDS